MSFFIKVFNKDTNIQTPTNNTDPKKVKIYLDEEDKYFLEAEISKEITCQQLHILHHNKIGNLYAEMMKQNNSSISKVDSASFVILDLNNRYTRLRLKNEDKPYRYLTSPSCQLYYLEIPKPQTQPQGESNPLGSVGTNKIINLVNPEEYRREGELMKYSFTKKNFKKQNVRLDKTKLMITKNSKFGNKTYSVILLSEISSVVKNTTEKEINESGYLFEIETYQKEKLIFKAKNSPDQTGWINELSVLVTQIREDRYFNIYNKVKEELSKEIYDKEMMLLWNGFSIKGVLSIEIMKKFYYSYFDNDELKEIIDNLLKYFSSLAKESYLDAFKCFKKIIVKMGTNNLEVENYKNLIQTPGKFNINRKPFENTLLVKEIVSLNFIKKFQKVGMEIESLINNEELNVKENSKETNMTLKKILTANLFNELFENLLNRVLAKHYKDIFSKNLDFSYGIQKLLLISFYKNNKFEMLKLPDIPQIKVNAPKKNSLDN